LVLFGLVTLAQASRTALIQDTDLTYSSKLPEKTPQNGSHFIFHKSVPLGFSSQPKFSPKSYFYEKEKLMTESGVSLLQTHLLTHNSVSFYPQQGKNK